jgi:LmbE family N-acetylglucosaminyl deacetylase
VLALQLPDGPLHVVALGAHPDDVEIGCGGLLLRLARRTGTTATQVVMTGGGERLGEAERAFAAFMPGVETSVSSLGLDDGRLPAAWSHLKDGLERVANARSADIVLAPRHDDSHQDHRLLADLVTTVWRDCLVLRYEIPKWDGDLGAVSHYVPLDERDAREKVALLNACYPSQRSRDWWDDLTFLGLLRLRGVECRFPFAEGYVVDKTTLRV